VFFFGFQTGCHYFQSKEEIKVRQVVDTVGFAHQPSQMDSTIDRIYRHQGDTLRKKLGEAQLSADTKWKAVISPHDDYAYVGSLYPAVLANLKADTLILFGVAHKAEELGLKDQLIFGSFSHWEGPYDSVKVASQLRRNIQSYLSGSYYTVHDSMMQIEHSLEALIPFIQYYNRDVTIVPVLVPAMPFNDMEKAAQQFAEALDDIASKKDWTWGDDFAIAISNDAVHYGDEGWGGQKYARYGTDSSGYRQALEHEQKIIQQTLFPRLHPQRIKRFTRFTVKEDDYTKYEWTWCGRYSVPFGLLTTYHLQQAQNVTLNGVQVDYSTSIARPPLPVEDLGMGTTAPANLRHWVGYTAIGYR
jgi:AmmeMemoRadiSam system protein B